MILESTYQEVFRNPHPPNIERKSIRHVEFLRDFRSGLHAIFVLKNDSYQLYSISDYYGSFKATLNSSKTVFTAPPTDIQVLGRGRDLCVFVTNVLSTVHKFTFDEENDQLKAVQTELPPATIFARLLPDQQTILAAGNLRISKYTSDGATILDVDLPAKTVANCFALNTPAAIAAIGCANGKVLLFDVEALQLKSTIEGASTGNVRALAFTPSTSQLLVGGDQQIVRLYAQLENESEFQWELKRTFSGHTDAITRICASATQSGERFASASIDGSVNLWTISGEAHYQTPVFSVQLKHEIATTINYSADGRYLCLATDEGVLSVYKLPIDDIFEEPHEFIGESEMIERFYELQGASLFDPFVLRKALNIYNDDEEGLIFWKLKSNPDLKLHEAYLQVNQENSGRLRKEEEAVKQIRRERRRYRQQAAFENRVERMRATAARRGIKFEKPTEPTEEIDSDTLMNEFSDIEALFAYEEPPDEPMLEDERGEGSNEAPLTRPATRTPDVEMPDDENSRSTTSSIAVALEVDALAARSGILLSSESDDDDQGATAARPASVDSIDEAAAVLSAHISVPEGVDDVDDDDDDDDNQEAKKRNASAVKQSPSASPSHAPAKRSIHSSPSESPAPPPDDAQNRLWSSDEEEAASISQPTSPPESKPDAAGETENTPKLESPADPEASNASSTAS